MSTVQVPKYRRIRKTAVVATGVLTTMCLNVSASRTANASPSTLVADASQAPTRTVPALPSKEQLLAANNLAQISSLQDVLANQFPESYGGLYNNGDDTFTIGYVGDYSKIKLYVDSQLTLMPNTIYGKPKVSYTAVSSSHARLQAVNDAVLSDQSKLKQQGFPIAGAGVDDRDNSVVVYMDAIPADAQSRLELVYPNVSLTVAAVPSSDYNLGRYDDIPPWAGGDQILGDENNGFLSVCTAGYGAHDANRNQFLISAGHCGNWKWYNSSQSNPVISSSTFVGASQTVEYGTLDEQTLGARGGASSVFWQGAGGVQYVANDASPASGNRVCDEGAVGLESCGVVTTANTTLHGVQHLFVNQGARPVHGDSGGPMMWGTAYGYLAQGTITQDASNSQGQAVAGENIKTEEFTLGVTVNSLTNP